MESLKFEYIVKTVGLPLTENQGLALCYKSAKHILLFYNEIQRSGTSYVPSVNETSFTIDGEILQLCTKTGITKNAIAPSTPVIIRAANPSGPLASLVPRNHTSNEPSSASVVSITPLTASRVPTIQPSQKQWQLKQEPKPPSREQSEILSSLGLPLPSSMSSGLCQSLSTGPDRTRSDMVSSAPVQHPSDILGNAVIPSAFSQPGKSCPLPGRRCVRTIDGLLHQNSPQSDQVQGLTVRQRSAIYEQLLSQPTWYQNDTTSHENDHSAGNENGKDSVSKIASIKQRAAMFEREGPIPLPRLIVPVNGCRALTETELVHRLATMIRPLVYVIPEAFDNSQSALKQLLQLMAGIKVFRPTLQQILAECRREVKGDADKFYTGIWKDYLTQYLILHPYTPDKTVLGGACITGSRPSSTILMRMVAVGDTVSAETLTPKRGINDVISDHVTSSVGNDMSKPKCVESENLDTICCRDASEKMDTTLKVESDKMDSICCADASEKMDATLNVESDKMDSICCGDASEKMDTTLYVELDKVDTICCVDASEKMDTILNVESDKLDTIQCFESGKTNGMPSVTVSDEVRMATTACQRSEGTHSSGCLELGRADNIACLASEKKVNNPSIESVKMDSPHCPCSNTLVRMVGTDTSIAMETIVPERDWTIRNAEEIQMDRIQSLQCEGKESSPCRDVVKSDSVPFLECAQQDVTPLESHHSTEMDNGNEESVWYDMDDSPRNVFISMFEDALDSDFAETRTTASESDREKSNTESLSVGKRLLNISDVLQSLLNIHALRKTVDAVEEKFLDALLHTEKQGETETIPVAAPSIGQESDHQESKGCSFTNNVDNLEPEAKDSDVLQGNKNMLYSDGTQTVCGVDVQCTEDELHRMKDIEVHPTKARSDSFEIETEKPISIRDDQSTRIAIEIIQGSSDDESAEDEFKLNTEESRVVSEKIGNVIRDESDVCDVVDEDISEVVAGQAAYEDGIMNDRKQLDEIRAEIAAFVQEDLDMIRSGNLKTLSQRSLPRCGSWSSLTQAQPKEELWKSTSFLSCADTDEESAPDLDETIEELGRLPSPSTGGLCTVVSGILSSQQQLTTAVLIDAGFMFTRSVINETASKLGISSHDNEQHQEPYRVTSFMRSLAKQAASYLVIPNWATYLGIDNRVTQDTREPPTNSASNASRVYQNIAEFVEKSCVTLRKTLAPYAHVMGVTAIGCLSLSHVLSVDALLDISMVYLTLVARPSMCNLLVFQLAKLAVGLYYFPQFQNYIQS